VAAVVVGGTKILAGFSDRQRGGRGLADDGRTNDRARLPSIDLLQDAARKETILARHWYTRVYKIRRVGLGDRRR
jgi:transcription termination factor Rho